jgi:hypothetical protein
MLPVGAAARHPAGQRAVCAGTMEVGRYGRGLHTILPPSPQLQQTATTSQASASRLLAHPLPPHPWFSAAWGVASFDCCCLLAACCCCCCCYLHLQMTCTNQHRHNGTRQQRIKVSTGFNATCRHNWAAAAHDSQHTQQQHYEIVLIDTPGCSASVHPSCSANNVWTTC